MTISFTNYPANNRNPGVFVEVDPSLANTGNEVQRTLIIGQMSSTSTLTPNVPVLAPQAAFFNQQVELHSMLGLMVQRYVAMDPNAEVWILPIAPAVGATTTTTAITVTGTAAGGGTIYCYAGGVRSTTPVAQGDTAATIASNLSLIGLNASANRGVSPTSAANPIPISFNNPGADGSAVPILFNVLKGEAFPPGVTVSVGTITNGGQPNPDIAAGLANLGDTTFDFIVMPFTDTSNLNELQAFLNDSVGRWSPVNMLYGHAFGAYPGLLAAAQTYLAARDDQHTSIIPTFGAPEPSWIWATELAAQCAISARNDPAVPVQKVPTGLLPPPVPNRANFAGRNTLLYSGGSTFKVSAAGTVILDRVTTTYQTNTSGIPDSSYLDFETMATLTFVNRFLRDDLQTVYARKKLVSNATRIAVGSNTVSPAVIKAHTIALYRSLEYDYGLVQNSDQFAKGIVVENAGGGRVNILAPVQLANQLRQIAILVQFTKP